MFKKEETSEMLLDIHEATGLPLNKFLLKIEMNIKRWNEVTVGNVGVTLQEAVKISTEIGVAIDYFVHCCVHTGVIAERFGNYTYSPSNARNEFTRRLISLTNQAKLDRGLLHFETSKPIPHSLNSKASGFLRDADIGINSDFGFGAGRLE